MLVINTLIKIMSVHAINNNIYITKKMPDKKYKCVVCNSISIVSGEYLEFVYVKTNCCSVHCYHKKYGNTQEGLFELQI